MREDERCELKELMAENAELKYNNECLKESLAEYNNQNCCVAESSMNYQEGYYRQSEQIKELQAEIIDLKKTLVNVALKL